VVAALDCGALAEGAFCSLGLDEVTVLRIKLISRMVEQNTWSALFELLGLSKDTAALVTLILAATPK
jgi:hypothetical protein